MGLNKVRGNMYSFCTHTWNVIKGKCPHDCSYCLSGETNVLMGDFTHKRISEIKIGDEVIGLETNGKFKKFAKSKVLNLSKRKAITIIIKTDKERIECTPEHKLYGSSDKRHCVDWRQAKVFSPYDLMRFVGEPKRESDTHKLGWIVGFIEGDGCFFKFYNKEKREYLGFEAVCVDEKLRKSFIECCSNFGISLREGIKKSSKKSYNKGKENPLIFSRASLNVKRLKDLYEKQIDEYFGKPFPNIKTLGSIKNFFEGYLGGLLDTDGSVSKTNQIRISQSKTANPDIYKRIIKTLKLLKIDYNEEKTGFLLKGGFPMRSYVLFDCLPKHSIKSNNLINNFSVKGTYKAEVESIEKGRITDVYNIKTSTENYIANGFIVHNCYMKRFPQGELRFDEKELKTDLGKGNFIFVGSSCDMFADNVEGMAIWKTLLYCSEFDNTYLFQTKNPKRYSVTRKMFPKGKKVILGTTLETNREGFSYNAQTIKDRVKWMSIGNIVTFRKMVTIEPIMDFDLIEFVRLIKEIKPEFVNIGADSGGNNLPEPPKEKVEQLIEELEKFTKVNLKDNLKRIMK